MNTRCNNCMTYYTEDVIDCTNCETNEYLMTLPFEISDMGWIRYMFVCMTCDAYIEYTTLENLEKHRAWCPCGSGDVTLIGWADASDRIRNHVTDITPKK
jgi:Zn finger protein HypA/HybF involved in hydrogenase expression